MKTQICKPNSTFIDQLRQMKVGENIIIEKENANTQSIDAAKTRLQKKTGYLFTRKNVGDSVHIIRIL